MTLPSHNRGHTLIHEWDGKRTHEGFKAYGMKNNTAPFQHIYGKLVHRVDAWLWRGGMHNPQVRGIVLVQLLFAGGLLITGALLAPLSLWIFWMGVGAVLMAQVFYGFAKYFAGVSLSAYSSALLLGLLLRSGGRLVITACVLYTSLIVCAAPALALLLGLCAACAVALATYALGARLGHN